jgi:uncharacterized protein (TIGR00369 family)
VLAGGIQSLPPLKLDAEGLNAFLIEAFELKDLSQLGSITEVVPGRARMVLEPSRGHLRPGGIVSGPTLMLLADVSAYAVILAHIGPVEMAVTSSLNIHFLSACPFGPVAADATLLRLGRRNATVEVRLLALGDDKLVAQATVAYAIP